uniref:Uncharacterized protein n=1 Tax=Anguilla anguilla TaxID=7936 RepID=A0A0E9QZE9_ANGAN
MYLTCIGLILIQLQIRITH